jgi:hypothetical protein
MNAGDALDAVDASLDALDALWRETVESTYPHERMAHLFAVLTTTLMDYTAPRLQEIWTAEFRDAQDALVHCTQVWKKWIGVQVTLTTQLWPQCARGWTRHDPTHASRKFLSRAQDVHLYFILD